MWSDSYYIIRHSMKQQCLQSITKLAFRNVKYYNVTRLYTHVVAEMEMHLNRLVCRLRPSFIYTVTQLFCIKVTSACRILYQCTLRYYKKLEEFKCSIYCSPLNSQYQQKSKLVVHLYHRFGYVYNSFLFTRLSMTHLYISISNFCCNNIRRYTHRQVIYRKVSFFVMIVLSSDMYTFKSQKLY